MALIVARSGFIRKSAQFFKRSCVEALGGEPSDGLGGAAPLVEEPPGSLDLGIEDRQGLIHVFLPIWRQDDFDDVLNQPLLVFR